MGVAGIWGSGETERRALLENFLMVLSDGFDNKRESHSYGASIWKACLHLGTSRFYEWLRMVGRIL